MNRCCHEAKKVYHRHYIKWKNVAKILAVMLLAFFATGICMAYLSSEEVKSYKKDIDVLFSENATLKYENNKLLEKVPLVMPCKLSITGSM